jgi:uncharacterized protein (TIGR00255 family)
MTGFGRATVGADGYSVAVEVRSVNQRFLRVGLKLPQQFASLDQRAREVLESGGRRGQMDAVVSIEHAAVTARRAPNRDLVKAYVDDWRRIARDLDLPGEIDVGTLAGMPEIFSLDASGDVAEHAWPAVEKALRGALHALDEMRAVEGERLRQELVSRVDALQAGAQEIAPLAEGARLEFAKKLRERVESVLREFGSDADAVLTRPNLEREIAVYADRTDVSEEMQRIDSHIAQFRSTLLGGSPAGRKLDFLVQELQREIGTLSAKVGDAQAGCRAVEFKSELEKIREQVQNVD